MQVKKQQLEPDMEQWTSSKLGKDQEEARSCMHEVKGRQISVLTVMPTVAHEPSQFPLSCTPGVLENLC